MEYKSTKEIDQALKGILKEQKKSVIEQLNLILSKLPMEFSELIEQSFKYKRIPKEYLLSSILFAISTSTGLTFYIKTLGYKNYGNSYFTIIGSRGDVKSESIKIATQPIKEMDDQNYDIYNDKCKTVFEDEEKTIRRQILIQNASIEAAHKVHSDNPNSVGIAIDEIFALVEKMGNSGSRDGIAWRNFFLEGYTNGHVDISRKTTESFRIKETYPTLIGGLQHQFLPKLFANGNLESGFIDRQFFTLKLTSNTILTRGSINNITIERYNKAIKNILAYKTQSENPEETIKQFKIELNNEAEERIFEYTQDLIDKQSASPPVIKEYMAKMQISIHKLCILVFMMNNATKSNFINKLTLDNVELAIDINEFYFLNFKSIVDSNLKLKEQEPSLQGIIKMAKKNNAMQKTVAEITGLNKSTITRHWNK